MWYFITENIFYNEIYFIENVFWNGVLSRNEERFSLSVTRFQFDIAKKTFRSRERKFWFSLSLLGFDESNVRVWKQNK